MQRICLVIEYLGINYYGWQIQKEAVTVQGVLERELSKFAGHPITTIVAGRTDTGVHAINQVVHFDTDVERKQNSWVRAVNSNLPDDVRIKKVYLVNNEFNARFSALNRTYHYYLLVSSVKSAILNNRVGWYHNNLDISKMFDAAKLLLGKQDFSSFRAAACQASNPIRELFYVNIKQKANLIRFEFTGNAFLHHMIRNIVGALIYVGNHKLTIEQFITLINVKNRNIAPPTFMPDGLYLADINYPESYTEFDPDNWLF